MDTTPEKLTQFHIRGEYITLGQLLKAANAIGSGGEVRHFLSTTLVLMNGETEARRGRKLREGDIIEIPGKLKLQIALHDAESLRALEDEE